MQPGPVDVRIASDADWPALLAAYRRTYREGHPLTNREFWRWRFGDDRHGVAIIAVADAELVGHLGAALRGGNAWIINAFVEPEFRGRGLLRELYGIAGDHGHLAATNVNRAGTDMYRNMGWVRYADLQRFVAWDSDVPADDLLEPVLPDVDWPLPPQRHYWQQPGVLGFTAPDGSSVVDQRQVGGLRVIQLGDASALPQLAFDAGYRWVDYVTSWNDPLCRTIDQVGWVTDSSGPVPWLLSPVVASSRATINVFAQSSLDPTYVISREDSDHGRVGSLPASDG